MKLQYNYMNSECAFVYILQSLVKQTSEDKVAIESNPASRETFIEADFTLPDLNLPIESGSETLCGTS